MKITFVSSCIFPLESRHCPPSSECRELIAKPMPECQTKLILSMFERDLHVKVSKCRCCYCCIKSHADEGCSDCLHFIKQFFPSKASPIKIKKSVYHEIKEALTELFLAMKTSKLRVEYDLKIDCSAFICDFLRVVDEIRCSEDIVKLWHIEKNIADKVFSILVDVLLSDTEEIDSGEGEDNNWRYDYSSSDNHSDSTSEESSMCPSENESESSVDDTDFSSKED